MDKFWDAGNISHLNLVFRLIGAPNNAIAIMRETTAAAMSQCFDQ